MKKRKEEQDERKESQQEKMKKGRTKEKIKDWKKEERGPILSEITPRRSAQILSSPMSPAKENDLSVDLIF